MQSISGKLSCWIASCDIRSIFKLMEPKMDCSKTKAILDDFCVCKSSVFHFNSLQYITIFKIVHTTGSLPFTLEDDSSETCLFFCLKIISAIVHPWCSCTPALRINALKASACMHFLFQYPFVIPIKTIKIWISFWK